MRLFLDANVLFTAAHRASGKAALVAELAGEGFWELVTSSFALEEARRNLEVKYPDSVVRLEEFLADVGVVEAVAHTTCPIDLPAKDQPIFLAALGAGCSHLLTGDLKHFGAHMNAPQATSGIIIQTVGEFLESLG